MNEKQVKDPLFTKIDCIRLNVVDINKGINFYHEKLGFPIIWKTKKAVGLEIPSAVSEIVLHTENIPLEVDFKVESVPQAMKRFEKAGGKVIKGLFSIDIGKCAVVQDPWGNEFVILDSSKGTYKVNKNKEVIDLKKT